MTKEYWEPKETMSNAVERFRNERDQAVIEMGKDSELKDLSLKWMIAADKHKYTYNFNWMGRPIIKYPGDIVVQQEIMWNLKPDLIIEVGVAHGGSVIFSASMQKMMDIPNALTVGVDIEIRSHNRVEIENSIVADGIKLIEGSSIDKHVVEQVKEIAAQHSRVMVILDSNHSHDHVLAELGCYHEMVSVGSYMILPDTFIEFFPKGYFSSDRPWDVGNNPYTACMAFMEEKSDMFQIDDFWADKALISETPSGYLKRVK